MVTEKDLYQNIEINCSSGQTFFLYLYDIENETMICKKTSKKFNQYSITRVLEFINKKHWEIIKPKIKFYELW